MKLGRQLDTFVSANDLGVVLPAPVDIKHPRGIASPVQPDLDFIPKRHPLRSQDGFFEGAPDLVIEVTSPSTRRVDEKVKLEAYRDAGVREYWLVDPRARTVVIFGLSPDGKGYSELQRIGAGETARSAVLAGFEVSVDGIFLSE
jgi:Uma2 family endonuclease